MLNAVLEESMFWEKDGVLESQASHRITYFSFRNLSRLLSYLPVLSTAGWLRADSHPKVHFDSKLLNYPLGFGRDMYTLLYLKWRTNRDLPTAQGMLLNAMWQPGWEGSLGENGHVCRHG